jgi:hypothetical protein
MKRLALIGLAFAALAMPTDANAALFLLFDQPSAVPNDRVTVRTGGTPKDFDLRQRGKPFQRPVRIYLVRSDLTSQVHSRFDSRLGFVGSLVPGRNGRGLITFSVPPLDPGTYTIAYWCPGCARHSNGHTFFVQQAEQLIEPYRTQALLRLEPTQSCPVTIPNGDKPLGQPRTVRWHGNGLLWAAWLSPTGVEDVPPERVGTDGAIGNKLFWATSPATRPPALSGQRLDAAAPPLRVLGANMGSFAGATKPSWATGVVFPTAGCWRLTARVGDVTLTYVVELVVR